MTDQQAIQLVLSGHPEAYAELIRLYQVRIHRLCLSMLSSSPEAEDATQEVFIKAYQALANFKGQSSFMTWIYRIASHHCLDLLRKRSHRATESWEALVEKEGEKIHRLFTDTQPGPEDPERLELLQRLLAHLPEDYREILLLREMEDLSYQEIADILHCSLDAVKARLRRAREALGEKARHFVPSPNV